ncbi:hypothetical protein NQ317_006853 [Molorchus minor]|uniref:Uncharacterized protein n=1 Tax=Molorchus minor TaxID=1323400 RepID=A0ABQ9K144_9CUCU|nr:hypothetical protein NQ317_006853 [Molorchus minor]
MTSLAFNDCDRDVPRKDNSLDINPYNSCVEKLSKGILCLYNKPLINIEKQIQELTTKQNQIIIQMHDENLNLAQVQHSPEKSRNMKLIYEQTSKLKKRALLLQQAGEKQEQQKRELQHLNSLFLGLYRPV